MVYIVKQSWSHCGLSGHDLSSGSVRGLITRGGHLQSVVRRFSYHHVVGFSCRQTGHRCLQQDAGCIRAPLGSADSYAKAEPPVQEALSSMPLVTPSFHASSLSPI